MTDTTWFVSDLHLGPQEGTDTGEAFAEFLDTVVRLGDAPGRRLVLLGDAFELAGYPAGSGMREDWAIERLGLLAARHQTVFAALRHCVESGITLDVVCGNHDIDLSRPRVREHFTGMVGGDRGLVRVHCWLLHEAGCFHACHGHQDHDLNRFPTMLMGTLPGPVGELPAPPLAALNLNRGHHKLRRRVVAFVRAVYGTQRAEASSRSSYYQSLLDRQAAVLGLPSATVHALASVSRFHTLRTAARLACAVPGRWLGLIEGDRYLRKAAARTHALLSTHGQGVPLMIYGHTHRARVERLGSVDAWYVNCGTWSSQLRGHGADRDGHAGFPYVVVERGSGRPQAALRFWQPAPTDHHVADSSRERR